MNLLMQQTQNSIKHKHKFAFFMLDVVTLVISMQYAVANTLQKE
jgi:hypothetical protein